MDRGGNFTRVAHHSRGVMTYSVVIAFLGSFLFGYTTNIIAGAILFLQGQFALTPMQVGFLVSSIVFGAMGGAVFGGPISDRMGRKKALFCTAVIYCIGIFFSLFDYYPLILMGRAITGVAVGLSSMIVPLYLGEISPSDKRGMIGSMVMIGISTGLLSAYLVNYWFSFSGNWHWMFGLGEIPAVLMFVGSLFVIESPSWKSEHKEPQKKISFLLPKFRYFVIRGSTLSFLQQISGINAVFYFAPTIFQSTGFGSAESATLATIAIGVLTVIAAIGATLLMDRWGRKPLLLLSLTGMILTLLAISIAFLTKSSSLGLISLFSLTLYTASFSIGLGPVMWVYLSEIYPRSIRGQAMSFAILMNWVGNYLVALVFLKLVNLWGPGIVFGIFAVISIFSFFFVLRFLPETKGQEI
jgi:SP family galactose:H+ symporter-like MFS transporter